MLASAVAMPKKSKKPKGPATATDAEAAPQKRLDDMKEEMMTRGWETFRDNFGNCAAAERDAIAAGLKDPDPYGGKSGGADQRRAQRKFLRTIMDVDLNDRDTHGNGDQSHVVAGHPNVDPGYQLRNLWSTGFDFNPLNPSNGLSSFCRHCFTGNEEGVKQLIAAARQQGPPGSSNPVHLLINRRESMLRMNGLLTVASGARTIPAVAPQLMSGPRNPLGTMRALLATGVADQHAKDIAGHGLMHHCAGRGAGRGPGVHFHPCH